MKIGIDKLTTGREKIRCEWCGVVFTAPKCHRRRFCYCSHSKAGRTREQNNNWKGGRSRHKQSGRITVLKDGKRALEHRVLTSAPSGKVVHHRDEDPTNNSLDNLVIMSRSEHTRLHNFLNPRRGHYHDEKGRFATRP